MGALGDPLCWRVRSLDLGTGILQTWLQGYCSSPEARSDAEHSHVGAQVASHARSCTCHCVSGLLFCVSINSCGCFGSA